MKNIKIIKPFIALLMLFIANDTFSQGFDDEVIDNGAPIDTNIWVLILVGLGYVFYKYRKLNRYEL